jgi:hypothetical protein
LRVEYVSFATAAGGDRWFFSLSGISETVL